MAIELNRMASKHVSSAGCDMARTTSSWAMYALCQSFAGSTSCSSRDKALPEAREKTGGNQATVHWGTQHRYLRAIAPRVRSAAAPSRKPRAAADANLELAAQETR